MSRLAAVLPFVLPEEEGLDSVSRPGFTVTTRSRIDDIAREEALLKAIDEAGTPEEVIQFLNALDALHAEQEADARRAQEEADAKYDEENSRW